MANLMELLTSQSTLQCMFLLLVVLTVFHSEARLERVDQVILDFSTEDCYFFWYKFQKLVGNICNISAPDTYRLAFEGVEKIVDQYIAIGNKSLVRLLSFLVGSTSSR